VVDTDLVLTDNRGMGFVSATVLLTNAAIGDTLSVAGSLPSGFTASVDTSVAGQITLTVTGNDPFGANNYASILRQVVFSSASEAPTRRRGLCRSRWRTNSSPRTWPGPPSR
jgi:hypothetical protein